MAFWRRFGSTGFDGFIYCSKRWHYVLAGGGAPSANAVVRLRGFRTYEESFHGGGPMFCYTHFRYYVSLGQAKPKPKIEGKGGDWRKPKVEDDDGIRINEGINEREVRLVTDQGHRIVSIQEALYLARKLDLDLVEVQRKVKVEGGAQSPVFKPAVCKLMDYSKEKYKQDVKEKERAKSKATIALRNGENKEVRFKAKTELKDLKIKAESVKRLMERGYRVKCTAMPTGKDEEDLGGLLLNLLSLIEDISVVESGPHLDTKNAYVIVKHIKFASKKGKKVSKAMETVSSVLSTRSIAAADNNSVSEEEDDIQTEEEWEAVESDSETETNEPSKQVETNTQNLPRSLPTPPPKVVGHDFASLTDRINKAGGTNAAGFRPPQPDPYVAETNRYSRGSNSTFNQIRPKNRDPVFRGNTSIGNRPRISEHSNRHEIEGRGLSNPNDRPVRNSGPDSSSSRNQVFRDSQSSSTSNYGIFSAPKIISSDDRMKQRDGARDDSSGAASSRVDTRKSSHSSPPSPRFGVFTSTKKAGSGDGRVGDKN
ncbi:uncharacterized protein LOC110031124 [Phalaenopsis equestris]|uniref:uncharacterized protein LOC110031124 n=1 Tax=Phalaenopsis equestris TaxID=78828 RepID=UPI0009E28DBF|nr:uncharacterized protein LOC110031124 [Phalaenopsis equestris]